MPNTPFLTQLTAPLKVLDISRYQLKNNTKKAQKVDYKVGMIRIQKMGIGNGWMDRHQFLGEKGTLPQYWKMGKIWMGFGLRVTWVSDIAVNMARTYST